MGRDVNELPPSRSQGRVFVGVVKARRLGAATRGGTRKPGAQPAPDCITEPRVETCERCTARIVRDPLQPPLCAGCAPPSDVARAIYKALAAHYANRSTSDEEAAPRKAVAQ
jgi:hypothetical protein